MTSQYTPNPERPLMIIRMRQGQEQGETWERTLIELEKNRACCDEVWFSTGIGYPPLEFHRNLSARIGEDATALRKIGIIPSLQIQATLGHSDFFCASADCSSKNWTGYTGSDGTECQYCSCPRQEGFLDYFRELSQIYAAWHPGSIWVDDDLRISNHRPVMEYGGCCCDHCLALFSAEEKHKYSREELTAVSKNDPMLEKRWKDFGIRGLVEVMRAIAESIHVISPETRIGFQHSLAAGRNQLYDAVTEATGMRACSRPGGGAYTDHNPFQIIQKAINMSEQMATQYGYEHLDQVCPEIETWPRVFSCKTSQGLRVESLFNLALGMDSLSYFIMDPKYESPEWYGRELLAPLAADAPNYKEFIRYNAQTLPGGVGLGNNKVFPGMESIGLPCAASSPYADCRLISACQVEHLPENQLIELLAGNIVIEGAAVAGLWVRGLESGIEGLKAVSAQRLEEYWTDDPLTIGLDVPMRRAYNNSFKFEIPKGIKNRVLGHYRDLSGVEQGISSVLLSRADGTRIAVLGCDFATDSVSTAQIRFFYRLFDWAAHENLPVLPEEPMQGILVPRVTQEKMLRSITVLNPTINAQKPFVLQLRRTPTNITRAEWLVPGEPGVELLLKRDNAVVRLMMPELAAWSIGWVRFQ